MDEECDISPDDVEGAPPIVTVKEAINKFHGTHKEFETAVCDKAIKKDD